MTTQEFSDSFDSLLNSYSQEALFGEGANRQDIVLDEYEKSVLLTQAQDIVVKSYLDASLNQNHEGIDDSSKRQVDFSSLITVTALRTTKATVSGFNNRTEETGTIYEMPSDLLYILNEQFSGWSGDDADQVIKYYTVVPISYKEYDRLNSKPYKQPHKNQCWRLLRYEGSQLYAEIITPYEVTAFREADNSSDTSYKIRYIRRPQPIILVDLSNDNLEIDGITDVTECELHPILHPDIVLKAVELAMSTRNPQSVRQQQANQGQQARYAQQAQ